MSRRSWLVCASMVLLIGCSRPVTPLPDAPWPSPTPAPSVVLPRDAGPHDALTEWWYYTGHLHADDGRTYGFEFTLFQVRRQDAPTGYLGHFAISDIDGRHFSHQAAFSQMEARSGFPLGVQDWTLDEQGGVDLISATMRPGPGADPPYSLRLQLVDTKPPALHHGGYIDYGPAGGSYYYSRTRLDVRGELSGGDGLPRPVVGLAWMDHQWGDFIVARGGWDWYSVQLDDRTELMLYVLRDPSGQTSQVYGSLVQPDGRVREVEPGTVHAEATGHWTSPHTGATYPSGWRLTLPDGRVLVLTPQLEDQELYFPRPRTEDQAPTVSGPAYWEGAVSVRGDTTGVGYVELTGYADQ